MNRGEFRGLLRLLENSMMHEAEGKLCKNKYEDQKSNDLMGIGEVFGLPHVSKVTIHV
jgi:hypothetical protein